MTIDFHRVLIMNRSYEVLLLFNFEYIVRSAVFYKNSHYKIKNSYGMINICFRSSYIANDSPI